MTKYRSRRFQVTLSFCLAALISAAPISVVAAQSAPAWPNSPLLKSYQSPAYQWTITYPAGWQLDESRADAVRITSDEAHALCGIYAAPVRFDDAGSFADFMLKHMADELRDQRGLQSETLWRRDIRLRTGQAAVEALVAIRPGGMSHRLFIAISNRGFGIDCEAEEANWAKVSNMYNDIIASFGMPSARPPEN